MPYVLPDTADLAALTFDIRKLFVDAINDPDRIQIKYDTVNRMVCLNAGMTFGRLFRTRWGTVIGEIHKGVDVAMAARLIRDPELTRKRLDVLLKNHPEMTWEEYIKKDFADVPKDISDAHAVLVMEAIHFPYLTGRPLVDAQRRAALGELLRVASDWTYQDVFTRFGQDEKTLTARKAIQAALQTDILFSLCPNDRCCRKEPPGCIRGNEGDCCLSCSDVDATPCDHSPNFLEDSEDFRQQREERKRQESQR